MEISLLIVTRNRPEELVITLDKLFKLIDLKRDEVLVFIDSCEKTESLIEQYPWVHWECSSICLGASPARNALYKKAKGTVFIGLDDDAHPLSTDFIVQIQSIFNEDKKIGIIAFQEVRGVFLNDQEALQMAAPKVERYLTNDFVGCGFAIRREVYNQTNGFPVWMDIYGEESCVGIEVLDLGYEIYYDNTIVVNHRVDRLQRIHLGRNYFRFEKQLKNTIYYYLVYFPNPFFKIVKLLFHNFKKYGLENRKYFQLFWKSIFCVIKEFRYVCTFRRQVKGSTLQKMNRLRGIKY
jgi:GT2 family glycosyltransferase